MTYKENPKTRASGILCCIPQAGSCPVGCRDCFFQSGRSYLEPLADNLPNMPPPELASMRVVRVNDGNDSNVQRKQVMDAVRQYPLKFYNTSIPTDLGGFDAPVVLTVNPAGKTDAGFSAIAPVPTNLMYVRVRTNTWNLDRVVDPAVDHYTSRETPVVLTFMAYWGTAEEMPTEHRANYEFRKRTLNAYWAIRNEAWRAVMDRYATNPLVHSCGIEGTHGGSACKNCGNCLREFYATLVRTQACRQ